MKRCVFVSGGAKGIGRACVELFASRGWQVAFMDVDADAGRELAGSLAPLPVIFLRGSTCSRQDVESAIAEAAANFGGLGCVVANAGIHRSDTILDVSPEQLRQVVDTNIFGTINTMQAALPAIIVSGGGSAVIVASDQSTVGKAHSFSYGLTKGALGQMARQTAIDMAPHGIRVNAVCPSTIATPLVDDVFARSGASPDAIAAMWEEENALFLRGSCGQPAEVASMVFFLASEEAGFCTGGLYPVDGGYTAM